MTKYTDVKNNTYKIKQKCILSEEERKRAEAEIIEELHRVFSKK